MSWKCYGNCRLPESCMSRFSFLVILSLCTDSNFTSEGVPDWQQWGPWSQCSATCGLGTTVRARSCCASNLRGNLTCVGNATEAKDCNSAACQGKPQIMYLKKTQFEEIGQQNYVNWLHLYLHLKSLVIGNMFRKHLYSLLVTL